ncbi:MAG: DUF4469 domain-containing protein [Prevotellaceae bacterium]|jgi:hypothetical protein|nr:DUF4469 domain-containing protein [Prevotellaceae bacterium]
MATLLHAVAHLNELTEDKKNDYFLLPDVAGTLSLGDIIKRLERREIAIHNTNGETFVNLVFEEIALATLEGYNVVTDLFHTTVGLRGAIHSQDLGHNLSSDKVHMFVRFIQGIKVQELVKNASVHVFEQPAPTGPVIQTVFNPRTPDQPNILTCGELMVVEGLRIAVRGDKTDEIGLYFDMGEEHARITPENLFPNTPSRLQLVCPFVLRGDYTLTIKTQATSKSTQFTKEVRSYTYPFPVSMV